MSVSRTRLKVIGLLSGLLLLSAWMIPSAAQRNTQRGGGKSAASDTAEVALVRQAAHPLTGAAGDYDPLFEMIGDARFVLLGEQTHGTHEFYRERARITRRLIEEKGFNAVVLEADWPDAFRVGQYARGAGADANVEQALSGFTRFPRWMWRNADFRDFVEWLRSHNASRPDASERVGVYGMDLYSVSDSADEVVAYLKRVDAEAAARARKRYRCLDGYRDRLEQYGFEVAGWSKRSCEKDVVAQLEEMEQRVAAWRAGARRERDEELFSAHMNARVVRHGEAYYRLMYHENFSTWNLRDKHMATTIQELVKYADAAGGPKAKVVVWAHNTHQGDARMTERGEVGELNVGQLMRQFHDGSSVLVGFTTYTGEVRAASEWGRGDSRMKMRPAIPESYSALFHKTGVPAFLLVLRGGGPLAEALARPRPQRAIGVVYLPGTERQSHYFDARLSKQFDAVIHWDVTTAVEPLK